jgi:outer membrane receptor protein involved in Fe transport
MAGLRKYVLILLILLLAIHFASAQSYEVRGNITEAKNGEPMLGVHIAVVGNVQGTISNQQGDYHLKTSGPLPFTLQISFVGFETQYIEVERSGETINIQMEEDYLLGQEVVISASRVEKSILQASVSVERLNLVDIQQMPSSNFYNGLYQIKGVDMNVHGLTFQLPNARGFNNYATTRMNQIVDGMENIAPGLSFAAGNIFGLPQLDVESVEMVVGASTVLYGPGGMNGTLVMTSKDPFRYQGLSVSLQSGVMNVGSETLDHPTPLLNMNLRYAKVFKDRIAIKLVGSYLRATDWQATDFRDRSDLEDLSLDRFSNPGYDGVNVYGDESLVSLNLAEVGPAIIDGIAESQGIEPGTPEYDNLYNRAMEYFPDQNVTRTGWNESDLVDDKTEIIRLGGSVHYLITEKLKVIAQGNYAEGTSVYTAQNRFSANNFSIFSGKLEMNDPNFFLRGWAVVEDAGDSYDIGGAAMRLNETWKPSEQWFTDYLGAYTQEALISGNMESAHNFGRLVADNRDHKTGAVFDSSKPAFPLPGSEEFNQMLSEISSIDVNTGGARVTDHSRIFQVEGMYDFSHLTDILEIQLGFSQRLTVVDTDGTIFFDEPGNPIRVNQFGTFLQLNKDLFKERLRITAAFRFDKNEYFEAEYTPRFSMIVFLNESKEQSIRGTFQTGYRFPTISDQWVDLDLGVFQTIGGMEVVRNSYGFDATPVYPMTGRNPIKDSVITENGPIELPPLLTEKVASTEIGYKGLFLGKKLFVDAYWYYNKYRGFQSVQLVAQLAEDIGEEDDRLFQVTMSTDEPVASTGWALGLDYRFRLGFLFRGNVAYNKLLEKIDTPGVETRYNTPEYRANLSFSHPQIITNLGFALNYHWQSGFLWESGFGAGDIPAFSTLDAHVTYTLPRIRTTLKLGASNLLNSYYTTSFGSANIGGLYYLTIEYNDLMGYIKRNRSQ